MEEKIGWRSKIALKIELEWISLAAFIIRLVILLRIFCTKPDTYFLPTKKPKQTNNKKKQLSMAFKYLSHILLQYIQFIHKYCKRWI